MRVLIIDDESLIRRALKRMFISKGHDAYEAADGLAGIEIWNEKDPDLVILDVVMPKLSGPEVLKLKPRPRKAKIILISAIACREEDTREVDLFLQKPFLDIFEVHSLAERLVGRT